MSVLEYLQNEADCSREAIMSNKELIMMIANTMAMIIGTMMTRTTMKIIVITKTMMKKTAAMTATSVHE